MRATIIIIGIVLAAAGMIGVAVWGGQLAAMDLHIGIHWTARPGLYGIGRDMETQLGEILQFGFLAVTSAVIAAIGAMLAIQPSTPVASQADNPPVAAETSPKRRYRL